MLEQLKAAVEAKTGRRMRTPKDFDELSTAIFQEQHTQVSTSTLKRIWGYVQTDSQPRLSSLDPLARFVGYADWDDFAKAHAETTPAETPEEEAGGQEQQPDAGTQPHRRWTGAIIGVLAAAVAIAIGCIALLRDKTADAADSPAPVSGQRVLHKGQDFFSSIDEYLALFGITATDTAYYQPLPGLDEVYAWGPEFGNTTWHNEGDKQALMPTITEYWTPHDTAYSDKFVRLVNEKLYYERLERDELRITFMRDIVDSLYVFLGIYRIDRQASNADHCVWRRVSDSCDTGWPQHIERLREH